METQMSRNRYTGRIRMSNSCRGSCFLSLSFFQSVRDGRIQPRGEREKKAHITNYLSKRKCYKITVCLLNTSIDPIDFFLLAFNNIRALSLLFNSFPSLSFFLLSSLSLRYLQQLFISCYYFFSSQNP